MADKPKFDLEAFKAFVAGKPRDEEYSAGSRHACALGQFGIKLFRDEAEAVGCPVAVYEAAAYGANGDDTYGSLTFGALSDRLNALTANQANQ